MFIIQLISVRWHYDAVSTADASWLNAEANAALCLVQWLESKIVSKEEMIEIDNIESHEELPGGSDKPEYGSHLIEQLSADLSEQFGEGFSQVNVFNFRRFYLTHRILQAPVKLSWTQYVELLPVC